MYSCINIQLYQTPVHRNNCGGTESLVTSFNSPCACLATFVHKKQWRKPPKQAQGVGFCYISLAFLSLFLDLTETYYYKWWEMTTKKFRLQNKQYQ